jgi:hypothetical protein
MKNTILLAILLMGTFNIIYAQDKTIGRGELRSVKIKDNKLDFFIIKNCSRLFYAKKDKYKFDKFGFLKLTFDKNNKIIGLFKDNTWKKTDDKIDKQICSPQIADGSVQKYTKDDINKCFNIIKNHVIFKNNQFLNWNDEQSCNERAKLSYLILDTLGFITSKAFALASYKDNCYGYRFPNWAYHVVNVMHCVDDKFYVLDPLTKNPIEMEKWKDSISYKRRDCEHFAHYINNCSVQFIPDPQRVGSLIFDVMCDCIKSDSL